MPSRRGTVRVSITGDERDLARATRSSEGHLGRLGKRGGAALRGLGTAAKYGGLALAAGLGVGLKKSADAAVEEEKALARVRAQLRAVGQDTPKVRAELDKMITSQSRMSGFDDEDLLDSYTNLLRVTQDHSKAIELNSLAMDFARGKQIDVAKAGELIGKVAGGNIGILGRYGIKVKEGATAQEALALVQKRFAGQAKEYGQSTAGSLDRAKVGAENLAEATGRLLTPAIAEGTNALTGFIGGIEHGTGAGGKFRDVVTGGTGVLGSFIGQIRSGSGAGGTFRSVVESVVGTVGRFVGQIRSGTGAGGDFRSAVVAVVGTVLNFAGALLSVGAKLAPVAGFLGGAALAAGQFGLKLLGSKAGVVALHAVLGALIGRLVGLGVAWGVTRISAFVAAIGPALQVLRAVVTSASAARGAMVGLTATMAVNPWTALFTVIGLVAGALLSFTGEEKRAKVSSDQLSDALLEQRDALRAVRDLDIEAKDAKLRHKSASLAVTRAEDNLRAVRKQFGKGSLEAKEAEQQLREARLEQIRANRNLQDTEQKGKDTRERSTRATRDAINAARGRVSSLRSEIDTLRLQIGLMGPFASKTDKGRAAQERLRAKERELAAAQRDLNTAIRAMPDRKVTYVDIIERHSRSDGKRPTKMVAPGAGFTAPTSGIGFARLLTGAAKIPAITALPDLNRKPGSALGFADKTGLLELGIAEAEGTTGGEFGTPAERGVQDDIDAMQKLVDHLNTRIKSLRTKHIPGAIKGLSARGKNASKRRKQARKQLVKWSAELKQLVEQVNGLNAAIAQLGGTTKPPDESTVDTGDTGTDTAPEPPPEPPPPEPPAPPEGPTPDEQAAIDRLNQRLGIALAGERAAGAAVRAFGSPGDIGTGKFANAYGAAANVYVYQLVPGTPQQNAQIGSAVVGALGSAQGIVTAPRTATA